MKLVVFLSGVTNLLKIGNCIIGLGKLFDTNLVLLDKFYF